MFADNQELTSYYILTITLEGQLRFGLILYFFLTSNDKLLLEWIWAGLAFGLLQIIALIFVAFFDLDYDPTVHFTMAGFSVLWSFMREISYFFRRCCVLEYSPQNIAVLVINGLLIALMVALAFAFALITDDYESLSVGWIEYLLYWDIEYLPTFNLLDLTPNSRLFRHIPQKRLSKQKEKDST